MAKPKRRKATLHSAGKVTEQDLLERARELAEDPSPAIPVCDGGCVLFSPVKAAQRAIPRIHAQREDEKALTRAANGGNELARAYAATLLLAREGKIPYVADIKLGGEIIPYVVRGSAKPFFLAGLQHYDDRATRLLAVASWARKRRMHFYSADRGIVCTGKRAAPPADFIAEEAQLLGLAAAGDARFTCGHTGEGVRVRWRAAQVVFERCLACASGVSTLSALLRHIAAPKPATQFEVEAILPPLEARAGVLPPIEVRVPEEPLTAYLAGRLPDTAFVDAARAARVAALKAGGAHFVAGDVSYGDDVDAFLRALGAGPDEERALRAAIAAHAGPVVLDRPTLARAVAELWPQHGLRMLEAASDAGTAARLHREKPNADEALDLLRKAAREGAGRAALAGLPDYPTLPPAAAAADAIARAFRGQGREAAVRVAQERANVAKAKGASLAMLIALQAHRGQEWRFSSSDQDVARSLAPHVEALLQGPPTGYHDALVAASRSAGETADIRAR